MSKRHRPLLIALSVIVMAWALALTGMAIARHLKVTPEKIHAYLSKVDFSKLSPDQRRVVLQKLAEMLNALSPEERRAVRMSRTFDHVFRSMTDIEKGEFMERTVPAGFAQMLGAFEQLPEDKRKKAIDDTLRRMREEAAVASAMDESGEILGTAPELPPELRNKLVNLGVKTFMDQGTPETKAQLQPVLEEIQRNMEAGRLFRPARRPRNE
jgi:predicted component of type VI protein secretion system